MWKKQTSLLNPKLHNKREVMRLILLRNKPKTQRLLKRYAYYS